MNIIDIILKKKHGKHLTDKEIAYFINGYVSGEIADYQASALLMAINLVGMSDEETFALTKHMLLSGETVSLSGIEGVCVDKHSTGGVGDSTTFVVAPILASLGLKVAKMSGRSLGHTGGTLDKLESLEGLSIEMTADEFYNQVNSIGVAIMGQTANICPADKLLYSLRDVTGTVDSIPLIASSIMSKKLAGGADIIVLDVKCGEGAFMKDIDEAKKLADLMCRIGKNAGKSVSAVISNMNEPLDVYVGNSLEIIGALEVLDGAQNRLRELSCILAAHVIASYKGISLDMARDIANMEIDSGRAKQVFIRMLRAQGGNPDIIKVANIQTDVIANESGYVHSICCDGIGNFVCELGGGRLKKSDCIDHTVGLKINCRIGDYIKQGDVIATIYYHNVLSQDKQEKLKKCIRISTNSLDNYSPLVYAHIDYNGNLIEE